MIMYKLINNIETQEADTVQRLSDNVCIPLDPANRDYQEYLQWLDDGNTPEEAD